MGKAGDVGFSILKREPCRCDQDHGAVNGPNGPMCPRCGGHVR